jgi:hypothetical protein
VIQEQWLELACALRGVAAIQDNVEIPADTAVAVADLIDRHYSTPQVKAA